MGERVGMTPVKDSRNHNVVVGGASALGSGICGTMSIGRGTSMIFV